MKKYALVPFEQWIAKHNKPDRESAQTTITSPTEGNNNLNRPLPPQNSTWGASSSVGDDASDIKEHIPVLSDDQPAVNILSAPREKKQKKKRKARNKTATKIKGVRSLEKKKGTQNGGHAGSDKFWISP